MNLDNVKLADIYYFKTMENQVYDSSMVYDLGNGKYIDLASLNGAIDFLILSTCAKFNIENDRLMDFGEGTQYKPGKHYVKCVRDSVPDIEWLKDIEFSMSKMELVRSVRDVADTKRVIDEAPYEPYFE